MEPKMCAMTSVVVQEYDNGTVEINRWHMDMGTRRMIPERVTELVQSRTQPLTADELLLVGAAECVAQALGYAVPLPW